MIDGIGIVTTLLSQAATASKVAANQAAGTERPVGPNAAVQDASFEPPPVVAGQLQLDIDRTTGRVVGRIVDKESGATITQIPSEEILRMIAVSQRLLGAVIDRKL